MDEITSFLREVDRHLDLPLEQRMQVARELVDHYRELSDDLVESAMDESEARAEAVKRLGSPREIARRLNAAHSSASWKSALLAAAPFAGWAACLVMPTQNLALAVGAVLGALVVAGSVRELVLGRRPVWLATWLAASFMGVRQTMAYVWPPSQAVPTQVIWAALSTCVLIALIWSRPTLRWRGTVVALVNLALIAAAWGGYGGFGAAAPLFLAILCLLTTIYCLLMAAACLFTVHRHGSAYQASLFLLTYFVFWNAWSPLRISVWQMAVSFAAAGVAVAVFARVWRWRDKAAVLAVGMLAKFALFDAFPDLHAGSGRTFDFAAWLLGLLITGGIVTACALVPMSNERAENEQRRAMVR